MAKVLQIGPNGTPKEANLGVIVEPDITYTNNTILVSKTIASGYTYSRFNVFIPDGIEISVENDGEFVAL
jgi:hypothetical protein